MTLSPTASTTVDRQVLTALARIHARRFLRHPLYVIGVLLLASGLVQAYVSPDKTGTQWDEIGLSTSMFLGIPGLIVAYRLTVTEEKAIDVLPSAPSDQRVRTLALCLACLVPAVTIVVLMALYAIVNQMSPPDTSSHPFSLRPADGTIGWLDYLAHHAEVVVAGVGGPLLGVVTARWLRFAGAGILVAVGLFLVELIGIALGEGGPVWQSSWVQAFNDLMPWVYWGVDSDANGAYEAMRPGSPVGHLLYAVALCGLAVTAAVLKDATPSVRATWMRRGRVLLAVAVVGYLWSVFG